MKFKSSLVSYLFGLVDHLVTPEAVQEAVTTTAPMIAAGGWVYPAALLATPLLKLGADYFEKRKNPEELAELYRESLLKAIEICTKDNPDITADDQHVVDSWREGLNISVRGDPLWKAILEDNLPTRMLSVDLRDVSTVWPLLRAQLECWTNWFDYWRTAGSAPLGFDIPRRPLALSREFERSLAANLPRELLARFQPELVDGRHRDAFNQSVLRILDEMGGQLRPLDPVRHIGEFPDPGEATTALKLLDAEYRVVPYIGRRGDLDALWAWLDDPAPVSFQVVVGRGGSGKTRLGYQFLEEIEERRPFVWHAGLLPHERFQAELKNEAFRRWRPRRPTLIVIDYADASAPLLAEFIVPELAHSGLGSDDTPIRFLLLARTADAAQGWYKTVRRAAGNREDDLFPNAPLELSALDPGQRRDLISEMLVAATRAKDEPTTRLSLPPESADSVLDARLAEHEFADPLVLSMAAIVAHGEQSLRALHLHRTDLARGVAKHERRRLEKLAGNRDRDFLLHMAAFVTLAGRMTFAELEHAAQVEMRDLGSSWKPGDVATILVAGATAEPITPDIIGEAFVHDVMRELAQHGSATLSRAAATRPGLVTRFLVRTVQDYAPDPARPAADDEPCQKWALDELTALLTRHAAEITDDVFWQIHAALPRDTVAMILPCRDFYQAVCRVRDPATNLVGLSSLVSYATYESKAGNRAEALAAIRKAVEKYRELAEKNREAFLPNLAGTLTNQATLQSDMGKRAEALQSIEEAVKIRRELAGKNREAFLPDLAMSLNNQAGRQSEMGQRAEALQSIEDAVERYRELAGKNREAFLPDLAMSLNNQAAGQSEMGQRAEALQSIEEAVKIRRELAGKNREAFLPGLAGSLNNQAALQSGMGQHAEALQSIEEAVEKYGELAGKNREAFLPDLAMSLNNQANLQSAMGQCAEALQSIDEAVRIRRELAGKNPEAFLPNLALSHGAWGDVLVALQKPAEAAEKFAEGLRLITPLALKLPQAHFGLAMRLAQDYRDAATTAGMELDPECLWPLDMIERLKSSPGEEDSTTDS